MRSLHAHPKKLTLLAWAIAAVAVVVLVLLTGPRASLRPWRHLDPVWLVLVAGGALGALVAYLIAYRALMHFDDGLRIPPGLALKIVAMGFGPFVPAGGFFVDRCALETVHGDKPQVGVRIFAIGALELAVLSPFACAAAWVLIAGHDRRPQASLLWPWALAVPVGFAIGFAVMDRLRRRDCTDLRRGGFAGSVDRAVLGGWMLTDLGRQPRDGWPAVLGMAGYWILDIASFYAAARLLGLHLRAEEAILAYATGYALTRRSMPLGGAGLTELLLVLALHWVGQPIGPAIGAVVVYRLFNFVLPAAPALWAHGTVAPLVAT